jgi:aryl-alcohol dehydrogenase-like predicted oxidoreductase
MHYRQLGQGLTVSAIGLGCMGMLKGGNFNYGGDADLDEAVRTVHRAIELGVTFFDTAEVYGPFANERLLGEAIKGQRDKLVIATKFGFKFTEDGKFLGVDSSRANIHRAVEGSLQRLGIDCIDLYYQHRVDPAVPIEEVIGVLAELQQAGKIKHIGLSEAAAATIRRAAAVAPIAALQSEYSIWEREIEEEILPTCRELGIGIVPYSPLGRGFLTGSVTRAEDLGEGDYRRHDPRYQGENFDANMAIVGVVQAIAARHGVSPAQVALAWLLAQGPDVVPIPGAKRRVTLEDSMAAADVTLSANDLAVIAAAAPVGGTSGPRYRPAAMEMVRL